MPKIILIKDSQRPSMPALQSSPEGLAGLNKRWPGRYYEVGGSVEQVVIKKKADVEPVAEDKESRDNQLINAARGSDETGVNQDEEEKPKKKRYKKKK